MQLQDKLREQQRDWKRINKLKIRVNRAFGFRKDKLTEELQGTIQDYKRTYKENYDVRRFPR